MVSPQHCSQKTAGGGATDRHALSWFACKPTWRAQCNASRTGLRKQIATIQAAHTREARQREQAQREAQREQEAAQREAQRVANAQSR